MMKRRSTQLFSALLLGLTLHASPILAQESISLAKKEVLLPTEIWKVPKNNDYNSSDSEYSNDRKLESDNIVLFWAKEYGKDPSQYADISKRFNPKEILAECERIYQFYVNDLKFVEKGKSLTDKYKLLIYVFSEEDGTAYGGGAEDKIGVIWTPAIRISKQPYGAIAHEMGHCFQYLAKCDGNWAFSKPVPGSRGNSIFEMTSQYMLWQAYPNWIEFENYHLKAFLNKTHFAFMHETNMYHAPFVLEYWSSLHGIDFIGKMWRESLIGEDPVMTYKRLNHLSQENFNKEMFEAYQKMITWDFPRIEKVSAKYANLNYTKLDTLKNGYYRIQKNNSPQNYGFNAIELKPTKSKVKLNFTGRIDLTNEFNIINPENAGWHYGFVAVSKSGSRTYGPMNNMEKGSVSFRVPKDTEHFWLLVMGAPKDHLPHLIDGKDETDEQWPYEIRLKGAELVPVVLN